jgi:competence protein ComEA
MEEQLSPFIRPVSATEPDFFTKYRYPLLAVLLAGLGLGIYLTLIPPTSPLESEMALAVDEIEAIAETPAETGKIVIDIAGGIKEPGVYKLNTGDIIEDAIEKSGGFSDKADIDEIARSINRAELLNNHSKIYIPKIGDNKIVYMNPTSNSYASTQSLININTATSKELETLTGIGEITAQRIIDYRLENGNFQTVEDIKNVTGISDNKFANIKDDIRI